MENMEIAIATIVAPRTIVDAAGLTDQAAEAPSKAMLLRSILQAMEHELIARWESMARELLLSTAKSTALLLLAAALLILQLILVFLAQLSKARARRWAR